MMNGSQNQEDASGPIKSLIHPKYTIKIGNWNVGTLYRSGNTAQAAREMTRRGIDVMGISVTHWTGQGTMQLAQGETIIYSGRDDNHRDSRHTSVKTCSRISDGMDSDQQKGYSSQILFQIH